MADKRIGELPLIEDLDDESFFVAEQQGAAGHITGAQIKGFARKSVEDIANASQKSAEAAAKSASAAQESATQAEEAQEAAESAKSGAEVAQKAAETAQGAAADAQAGAESAKTAAEAAADVAAKDAAEGVREELSVYVEQTEANAQAAADSASEAAVSQEAAAQSAQGAAGSATAAAQDAVDAADARTAAEAAQGKAEAAQGAAEAAKSGAETAAGTATTKAEEASESAETAKQYSGKPPKPQNGTWWVWNAETQAYTDTGIKSVLSIVKSYPSVEAMEADKLNMHEGDLVIIASTVDDPDNSKLYVHDGVGWVYLSDLSGVEGVGIAGISQTDGNHAPGTTDTYTIELTDGSSYEFTVYNGADGDGSGDMQSSTYDPQGKAQDIFGYADNAAKGKQDKLKGTAGQVVGFDSEGNAIPQAVGGVTTFNGRSGAVVPAEGDYTAEMVGARPESWIPSAADTGAVPITEKGAPNGVATLGQDGKLPPSELPPMDYDPAGSAAAVQQALTAHTGNKNNPHAVTAEQVGASRAVKGTYPIAAGQSIQAGDVVDVVEGQLQKTVTAVPNVNTVVNKTAYAELQMVHLSKDINVQIYMNSRGGTMYANILDDNGGIVLKGQNLGMDMENIAAARLDDTHVLVGFVLSGQLSVMVGTVSGKTISFGDSVDVDGTFDRFYSFAALPNGRVAVVYKALVAGPSKLRMRVFKLSSSSFGSVYTRDVTGESQIYISAAAISEERVCICFADQNDNSKGKAVVAAINGSNVVSWGEVVTFCDQVGYDIRCCTVGEKVIATGYYNDTKLCLLGVTGNQITVLHNGNAITTSQTGAIAAISDNQAVFITAYAQESKAVVLTVNGNALDMGTEFDFARSTAIAFALTAVSNKRLLAAYEDIGNSNYGTVTTLTVSGNQIAGSFVDGSQDAIALQGGTAGQSIEVIYSGTVAADWVTDGQVISSPGVYGAGVLAGVLQVWSKYMPRGHKMVTGIFIGRQGSTSDLTNNIELGFRPQYIVVLSEASPNTRRIALPGLTYRWNANDISSNDGLTITDTGFLIANNTTNNNEKYHYVAFG